MEWTGIPETESRAASRIVGRTTAASSAVMTRVAKSRLGKVAVVAHKPEFFFAERRMCTYSAEWMAFAAAVECSGPLAVTLDDSGDARPLAEASAFSLKSENPGECTTIDYYQTHDISE